MFSNAPKYDSQNSQMMKKIACKLIIMEFVFFFLGFLINFDDEIGENISTQTHPQELSFCEVCIFSNIPLDKTSAVSYTLHLLLAGGASAR